MPTRSFLARIRVFGLMTLIYCVVGAVIWVATKDLWWPDFNAGAETSGEVRSVPARTLRDFQAYPFLHQAHKLMAEKNYGEAAEMAGMARQINPTEPEVWLLSAQIALFQRTPDKALTFVERGLTYEESHGRLTLYKAITLDRQGEFAAARLAYRRALGLGGLTPQETQFAHRVVVGAPF